MLILSVVGARPNFMKMAPVIEALARPGNRQLLVHTGQHYDHNMSKVFFDQLGMPQPDIYLGIGSDTHARQTARIMTAIEEVCQEHRPDLVLVAGDVNSTAATALVTAKSSIPLGHVEAGLRSFDREMPEEVNRVVVDHLSDLLFTTEADGDKNLHREGISPEKIFFVGNCMVDSLLRHREQALAAAPWRSFDLEPRGYQLLTLHRPSNVDHLETLKTLLATLATASVQLPMLFPVHPRTRQRIEDLGQPLPSSLRLCEPLPYLTFLGLMASARVVLTDSGGIQEETTVLDVPCLTLRRNTERPVTCDQGSNRLVGTEPARILDSLDEIFGDRWPAARCPPLWDGQASRRIADVIEDWSAKRSSGSAPGSEADRSPAGTET